MLIMCVGAPVWLARSRSLSVVTLDVAARCHGVCRHWQIRATPLVGSPITVTGTALAAGGVTVNQIRQGGLTIVVSTACDRFADPVVSLQALAGLNNVQNASALTVRGTEGLGSSQSATKGVNLLFAGLTSTSNAGQHGWNSLVKPRVLTSSTPYVNMQVCHPNNGAVTLHP